MHLHPYLTFCFLCSSCCSLRHSKTPTMVEMQYRSYALGMDLPTVMEAVVADGLSSRCPDNCPNQSSSIRCSVISRCSNESLEVFSGVQKKKNQYRSDECPYQSSPIRCADFSRRSNECPDEHASIRGT